MNNLSELSRGDTCIYDEAKKPSAMHLTEDDYERNHGTITLYFQ